MNIILPVSIKDSIFHVRITVEPWLNDLLFCIIKIDNNIEKSIVYDSNIFIFYVINLEIKSGLFFKLS